MTCVKIIFTIFNLVFMAGSIALIYFGVALLTEMISFDYGKFLDQDGFYNIVYVAITLGVFILILSLLGCFGTIRGSPCLLGIFGSIMTLIVVTQIVLCVLLFLYRKEVENASYWNSKEITKRIVENYNYTNTSEPFTRIIDNVQKYMRCCGVNGTADWRYGKVPYSCCENNNTQIHWNRPLQEQYRVTTNIQYCLDNKQGHYAYQEGCLNKVINVVTKNIWYLGSTAISFALVQIMAILLSCCIAYSSKKPYETI